MKAPAFPDDEEATRNPRPPDDRVSVATHHAAYCPADKLLGRVGGPPIGKPEGSISWPREGQLNAMTLASIEADKPA